MLAFDMCEGIDFDRRLAYWNIKILVSQFVYEGVTEVSFLLSRKHLYGLLDLKKAGHKTFALQCHCIVKSKRGK